VSEGVKGKVYVALQQFHPAYLDHQPRLDDMAVIYGKQVDCSCCGGKLKSPSQCFLKVGPYSDHHDTRTGHCPASRTDAAPSHTGGAAH
jgi:hypothetical protein